MIDLTISNPTHAGFVYDSATILPALSDTRALVYEPQPKGLYRSREAVAAYYLERGTKIDPEEIVLTTSTSEGYSHIFRLLCDPGDEVLVPKPSYPLFEFLADMHDVKLIPYPLIYDHGWQIDLPSLEGKIGNSTRAVVVVHPNNPTGSYISAAERRELICVCQQHRLALIADEVFLDYGLDGAHGTFADQSEALTFTLSGISKISGLPQMKLAWVVLTGPAADVAPAIARMEIIADTFLSMSAPVQLAAPMLLDQCHSFQPALLQRVRANLSELDEQLSRQSTCRRLAVHGGWYAILRVPATQADEDLAVRILKEASVLVHPGHFYDFPSDGYLVLSLIAEAPEFGEGVQRILALVGG